MVGDKAAKMKGMKTFAALALVALSLVSPLSPAFAQSVTTSPVPVQDDAPAPVRLSEQDRADLKTVEDFFRKLPAVKANFTQAAQQLDGTTQTVTGTFKLWRPGRLRIEYAAPSKDFIVADGSFIYQWDDQMHQQSQTRIEETLPGFMLKRDLRFDGDDVTATRVAHPTPTRIEVSLRSAKDPSAGEMTLLLDDVPLRLVGWRVLDAQGLTTTVALSNVETGVHFERSDFVFRSPTFEDRH